jgi:hypothetical protein
MPDDPALQINDKADPIGVFHTISNAINMALANLVKLAVYKTLTYYAFPDILGQRARTKN